jgi:hypothetical protein
MVDLCFCVQRRRCGGMIGEGLTEIVLLQTARVEVDSILRVFWTRDAVD